MMIIVYLIFEAGHLKRQRVANIQRFGHGEASSHGQGAYQHQAETELGPDPD
jgi:hypothetical protein